MAPHDADDDAPPVINVIGRANSRENADLQGEYRRIGICHGRPAYRKPGTRTVIRYWSVADRWLIDREGLQESDVCNAYAEQGGAKHPGCEELVWCVWETNRRSHVRDPEFLVTSAPPHIQVIGRADGKENWALNGEYRLIGLHQGRVAYQKAEAKHAIRYWTPGDRWLIDLEGLRDVDVCNAYANACGSTHPGTYTGVNTLSWCVWDSMRSRHLPDACLQVCVAPAVIELHGRDAPKENASMNGSYHIIGLHAGRPAYQKTDGSGHAIRWWPREERWLLDLDGLREADVCNAYAEANPHKCHPGDSSLVWHTWETSRGRHLADPSVRTFVAPHFVRFMGRDPYKENSGINGEYELVALVDGLPGYRKPGTEHVIRYYPQEDRWLVDLEAGFHGGDVANCYADAKGCEHPGSPDLIWHLWESSLGKHMKDEEVIAEAAYLPKPDWAKCPGGFRPVAGKDQDGSMANPA